MGATESRAAAFTRLIEDHARLMAAAIRRVCRDPSLVPDAEQEVKMALWKRLESGKKIDHPVSYVYKVALTTAASVVRRHARGGQPIDLANAEDLLVDASTPTSCPVSDVERQVVLQEAIESLPRDEARALRGYLAGLNHKDIAQMYSWSESVARHRIYRAMDRLRDRAEEHA